MLQLLIRSFYGRGIDRLRVDGIFDGVERGLQLHIALRIRVTDLVLKRCPERVNLFILSAHQIWVILLSSLHTLFGNVDEAAQQLGGRSFLCRSR